MRNLRKFQCWGQKNFPIKRTCNFRLVLSTCIYVDGCFLESKFIKAYIIPPGGPDLKNYVVWDRNVKLFESVGTTSLDCCK